MDIKEAVKNIEAELNCRKEDEAMCMKYECREGKGGCPFYIIGLLVGYGMCEDKQNRRKGGEQNVED